MRYCYQTLRIIKFRRRLTLTLALRSTMTERRICTPLGDSLAIVLPSWPGALWPGSRDEYIWEIPMGAVESPS